MKSKIRETTLRQYKDIIEDFNSLIKIKTNGREKYSANEVLEQLSLKYYKSVKTIEIIVSKK